MNVDSILSLLVPTRGGEDLYSFLVDRALCLGPPGAKHLSGGACTAALIGVLEAETDKPLIQASAQFRKAPSDGDTVTIAIDEYQPGRSIDLISASIVENGSASVSLSGSFGRRRSVGEYSWQQSPKVKGPEDSPPIPFVRADTGDLHTHLDMRLAATPKTGQMAFWVKAPRNLKTPSQAF